ncbi:MAG TPA: hypothetical protein VFV94_16050 [Polyangiaceae bacterium]|jgi:hypothetical protein|nr:hypothetical protein [Polyangiaceae bacterium]
MSKIEETKPSTASEAANKAGEGPTEYAPMPILLPLAFLIGIGLIIAYGVVSR